MVSKHEFILKNKSLELTVYQSQAELNDENYKESLYLPFTDNTSGVDSYGGGRYMDLNIYDIKINPLQFDRVNGPKHENQI